MPTEFQATVKEKKKKVQKLHYKELGIRVDSPKQGYGSTNDDNTARIFFDSPKIVAEITGIFRFL